MKYPLLLLLISSLLFFQLLTQQLYPQNDYRLHQTFADRDEALVSRLNRLSRQGRVSERELQRVFEDFGYAHIPRTDAREIVDLLRSGNSEEQLKAMLSHLEKRGLWRKHKSISLNSVPITKANDQLLTANEQTMITQVLEDFQVNENEGRCDHYYPSVAVYGNNNFVAVWEDYRNGPQDIYGQRYSGDGTEQGDNFLVNDDGGCSYQSSPAISTDSNGNFVVVWQDDRNGDYDIYGQRYSSDGSKLGDNFLVNDDQGSSSQFSPAISTDSNGNFVVVWGDKRNGHISFYGQRYSSDSSKLGDNFLVNDDDDQGDSIILRYPAISTDRNGNFVVVWKDKRNGDYDIYGQRYSSDGGKQGGNFLVNDDAGSSSQNYPAISTDNYGNFVVVWRDERNGNSDIYGQHYRSDGVQQGDNFLVNDDESSSWQHSPAISTDSTGNFVVVWQDSRNGNFDIYSQHYSSDGSKQEDNFLVNDDENSSYQSSPAISTDSDGNFVVMWRDDRSGKSEIYGQRYINDGSKQGDNFLVNDDQGSSYQSSPAISTDSNGNFVVVWQDDRNVNDDIYGQRYNSDGVKQGDNLLVNDDESSRYQYSPAISTDSNGNFVVVWEDDRNRRYGDIYGQRYSSDGSKLGENFLVNDDEGRIQQSSPAISTDSTGNFVVVWQDGRNGNIDIYGQRYNSDCSKLGENFLVNNDGGSSSQDYPAISTDSNGNFMVVWRDARNGNTDIYGQRYSSAGSQQGANFVVNDDEGSSSQDYPAISSDSNGNFMVVWRDARNGNTDIYGQFHRSNGSKLGENFLVNDDSGSSSQYEPSISTDPNGNFVVVWGDNRNGFGLNDPDIYAQLFNKNGEAIRSNYRVNNDIGENIQGDPDVKLVNNMIFYTWQDTRVPGQGYDIFARVDLFNSAPAEPVLTMPVNKASINNSNPGLSFKIPLDADGDFLHFKLEIATEITFTNHIPGSPFESQADTSGFSPAPPLPQGVDSCSFTLQDTLDDGHYYWRVTAYDRIDYGKVSAIFSFTIDTKSPGEPCNLLANGANPSPLQQDTAFILTWENPPDVSGIERYYYKLGSEPVHNSDAKDSVDAKAEFSPRITVKIENVSGDKLSDTCYVWLRDGAGNINYKNNSSVCLRYYNPETMSEVTLLSPEPGDTLNKYVYILSNDFEFDVKDCSLKYKMTPRDQSWHPIPDIPSPDSINAKEFFKHVWQTGRRGNVLLKLSVWDSTGTEFNDTVQFTLDPNSAISTAIIYDPRNEAFLHDSVSITGYAQGNDFTHYSLSLSTKDQWLRNTVLKTSSAPTINKEKQDELLKLNTKNYADGEYTLVLEVENKWCYKNSHAISITIDNTPPIAKLTAPLGDTLSCYPIIEGIIEEQNLQNLSLYAFEAGKQNAQVLDLQIIDNYFMHKWEIIGFKGKRTLRLFAKDEGGLTAEDSCIYYIKNSIFKARKGLRVGNNEFSLYIPPEGYVQSAICLEKKTIDECPVNSENMEPTTLIVEIISQENLETFYKPAILSVDYAALDLADYNENKFSFFGYGNDKWHLIGGTSDKTKKIISTAINRIGIYGLFECTNAIEEDKALQISFQPRIFSPRGGGYDTKTAISFELGKASNVTIQIYNAAGRLVRVLIENEQMPFGSNVVYWNGTDDWGNFCVSDLYIVTIQAGDKKATKTVVVLNK